MPNDLRQFFDTRRLDERTLSMIEFVVMSPAYEEAFKPYLESVKFSMQELCKDRSQARKDAYPDDFLYGGICAIEGLIKFFTAAIHEANFDRIHEAMSQVTPEKLYEAKRQQGKIAPVVGVNQDAEPKPYDPAEDF